MEARQGIWQAQRTFHQLRWLELVQTPQLLWRGQSLDRSICPLHRCHCRRRYFLLFLGRRSCCPQSIARVRPHPIHLGCSHARTEWRQEAQGQPAVEKVQVEGSLLCSFHWQQKLVTLIDTSPSHSFVASSALCPRCVKPLNSTFCDRSVYICDGQKVWGQS